MMMTSIKLFLIAIICTVSLKNYGVVSLSRKAKTTAQLMSSFTHKLEPVAVPQHKKLELVHIVFRHGRRTPADTYPNDPYINESFDPIGWGRITNEGKVCLRETGRWLRVRYNDLLGSAYYPELIHAQATGIDRTKTTLAVILSTLFTKQGGHVEYTEEEIKSIIPIKAEDLDKDTLLLVRVNCPRYYEALHEVHKYPEIQRHLHAQQALYDDLTHYTGMKIESPEDVGSLYGTLLAESEFGLKLPSWTDEYFPHRLQNDTDFSYIINAYTDELQRIKAGPFIQKMAYEWERRSHNRLEPKGRKMFMYCGHDSTLVNIFSALKIWKPQFPGYNIMFIAELYRNVNTWQYDVKFYQKDEGKDPVTLQLPGCDVFCPLNKVLQMIKPILPKVPQSVVHECTPKDPNATTPPPTGP